MSYPEIKAGVVGTGFIGTVHAEAIRRTGAQLVGVVASNPESGERAAARMGTQAFASLDDLLAVDVDVVHVTSPNAFHADQAIACLRAGKHVVCEKPLATTLDEAIAMKQVADETGLVNALNFNIRFYPQIHEARARVAAGDVGKPILVHGHYIQDWLLYDTDWNWRLETAAGGETRAISDIGSHWLDAMTFVTGEPITQVSAELHTVHPVRRRPAGEVVTFTKTEADELIEVDVTSDDIALVHLRFANGARGSVVVSQVSAGRKNLLEWEVDGTAGSLAWNSERPDELWLGHRDEPNGTYFRNPGSLSEAAAAITFYPGGHVEGFGETFRGLFERVYADIRAGRPSEKPAYPDFADGVTGLKVEEAIRRSAASGNWENVEETK